MTDHHSPKENHLLAALPADAYERLFHNLEPVVLTLGNVIYESGDELRYAYFPATCIISLLYVMENGASAEIAVVGNEGMIGVAHFMGGNTMPNRAIVQSAGYAYRLRRLLLMEEFGRTGGVAKGC
jgi:hypothetical protein